jgi:hypothetical protein
VILVSTKCKNRHWREDSVFNKWCWVSTHRRLKLDPYLSPCTKINSKWINILRVRPESLKYGSRQWILKYDSKTSYLKYSFAIENYLSLVLIFFYISSFMNYIMQWEFKNFSWSFRDICIFSQIFIKYLLHDKYKLYIIWPFFIFIACNYLIRSLNKSGSLFYKW